MALEGMDGKFEEQVALMRKLGILKYTDSSGRCIELDKAKAPETTTEKRK